MYNYRGHYTYDLRIILLQTLSALFKAKVLLAYFIQEVTFSAPR
jgi:hypothetical protein